jgi:membrane protein
MDRITSSLPGRVLQKFVEDQAPNWAVLIAWNALFAMFPIVVFAAGILGLALSIFGIPSKLIYTDVFSAIPDPAAQSEILKALTGLKTQTGLLFVVGLIGTLWGGSALFGAMEQAFAVIYHTRPRDFLRQKLLGFAMVILFTLLAGAAVTSSSLLPALKQIPDLPGFLTSGIAAFMLQVIVGLIAGFILFFVIYYVIPNRTQKWRKVLPGAIVSGILFELVTLVFPLYLSINSGINAYGKTFGLFFVLLTFFFFLGLITMLGVEVNSVVYPVELDQRSGGKTLTTAPRTAGESDWRGGPPQEGAATVSSNGHRRGVRARTALGLAVVASVVGVLLGRRSAGNG